MDKLTTSRHPDELYINGIQRESFLPAIQLIKDRFEVVDLNSPTGQSPISYYYRAKDGRLSKNPPSPFKSLLRPTRYPKSPRTTEDIHFISINRPSLFRYPYQRQVKIMGPRIGGSGMFGQYSEVQVFGPM